MPGMAHVKTSPMDAGWHSALILSELSSSPINTL